jgi:hypothetical protein
MAHAHAAAAPVLTFGRESSLDRKPWSEPPSHSGAGRKRTPKGSRAIVRIADEPPGAYPSSQTRSKNKTPAGGSKDGARCGPSRLIRTFLVTDQTKEDTMHPLVLDYIVRQHIEDLHREAAVRRLAGSTQKRKPNRRKAPGIKLQRAPAH